MFAAGDSFHIKTHFHYTEPTDGEMSFRCGDVFHVADTLHNGTVGAWHVFRIGPLLFFIPYQNIDSYAVWYF
jgi:hypothetical protein